MTYDRTNPLEKFLNRADDSDRVESANCVTARESISTLEHMKYVLKLTENYLRNLSTDLNLDRVKTIQIKRPDYANAIDVKLYAEKITAAKIRNYNVVYEQLDKIRHRPARTMSSGSNSKRNVKFIEINADDIVESPKSDASQKKLVMQVMPSINIRSQLMEQKFPALSIEPEVNIKPRRQDNIATIKSEYEDKPLMCEDFLGDSFSTESRKSTSKPRRNVEVDCQRSHAVFYNSGGFGDEDQGFSRKGPSTMRKFAVPEVQNIYNPKPMKFLRKFNAIRSQSSVVTNQRIPISTRLQICNTNKFSTRPSTSSEYIPYSKLTVGGLKVNKATKPVEKHIKFAVNDDLTQDSDNSNATEPTDTNQDVSENLISEESVIEATVDKEEESLHKPSPKLNPSVMEDDKSADKSKLPTCSKGEVKIIDFVHKIETEESGTQYERRTFKSAQTSPFHAPKPPESSQTISSRVDIKSITIADMMELRKTLVAFNSQLQTNVKIDVERSSLSVDTQTSPSKSPKATPSKMIDRNLSPIRQNNDMSVQTIQETPNEKSYSTSETQTDVSLSESSETLSLGEINLTVLKKKYITIRSDPPSSASSLNRIKVKHVDKSEGEISLRDIFL